MRAKTDSSIVLQAFLFLMVISLPSFAWAQIDEIVVSVRKMEESLQDVPLSVSALDNEQIQRLGIADIRDVAKYTPGIEFDDGFGAQDTRIVIRGLSPTRGRPNVAFLVDGIDFTGEAVGTAGGAFSVNQRLLDVERVEVVKGPQSALYGRSAFGGAIQYITKTPSLEGSEVELATDFGSEDQFQVTAAAGMPFGDRFGVRANLMWYDEAGLYNNTTTSSEVGGSKGSGLALTGLWEPSDKLSFKARGAFSDEEYQPAAQARVFANRLVDINDSVAAQGGNNLISQAGGPFGLFAGNYPDCPGPIPRDGTVSGCFNTPKPLVVGVVPGGDELSIKQSHDARTGLAYSGTDLQTTNVTLVADWSAEYGVLKSFTGLSHTESDQKFDGDWDVMEAGVAQIPLNPVDAAWGFTPADCINGPDCSPTAQQIVFENETDLFSQEFRFATNRDGFWNLTTGALYWTEDVDQQDKSISITPSSVRGDDSFFGLPPDQLPTASSILGDPAATIIDPRFAGRDTEHWSVYASLDLNFSEAWKLTLEGRYVDEEVTVEGPECLPQESVDRAGSQFNISTPVTAPNGEVFCGPAFRGGSATVVANGMGTAPAGVYVNAVSRTLVAESETDFFVPKAILEWQANDDQLWYVSVGRAIKPGGISTVIGGNFFVPENNRFDDEKLIAYEVGGKTVWGGGNIIVNAAAFYQDYTDKQVGVTRFNPLVGTDVGTIENAGESEIKGFEIDAQWQINDNFFLSAGYTWTDAVYSKFEATTGSTNEMARLLVAGNGGCLEVINGPPGETGICRVSFTGNDIEDIPEHSFVGYGRFSMSMPGGELELFVDASTSYRSQRFVDETNIKLLDEYWLVDTRIGLIAEAWEVVFFVDNLFDDDTVKTGVDFGSQVDTLRQAHWPPAPGDGLIANLPKPRLYGVRAAFRYGANK